MLSFKEFFGLNEADGLWANIHKKRERIKKGSGEKMRKPGSEGAPTDADLKNSRNEERVDESFRSTLLDLKVGTLAPAVAKTAGPGGVRAKDIVACAYVSLEDGSDATYAFTWHDDDNDQYCVSTCVMVSMSGTGIKCQSVTGQPEGCFENKIKAIAAMKALAAKGLHKKNGQIKNESNEDRAGHKSPTGGLTQKGRDHYNRENGSNLKAPVTTPPSELDPDSKAAKRRKSFCARMTGVDGPMKNSDGTPTRKKLALDKWNC